MHWRRLQALRRARLLSGLLVAGLGPGLVTPAGAAILTYRGADKTGNTAAKSYFLKTRTCSHLGHSACCPSGENRWRHR